MRGRVVSKKASENAGFVCAFMIALGLAAGFLPTQAFVSVVAAQDGNRAGAGRSGGGGEDADEHQHGRDLDGPSEDGTDDDGPPARPPTAEPEQAPGCRFRNAPLELLV